MTNQEIQEQAEDKQWLDEAKEYAKSRGIDHLDFTDENYWLDYKNNYRLTPEEAVDDDLYDY